MEGRRLPPEEIEERLYDRYPALRECAQYIEEAYHLLCQSFSRGGKLLIAGNGGSASDSDHIVGELLKSFRFPRAADEGVKASLADLFGEAGQELAGKLENGVPAISLPSMSAMVSAYGNDVSFDAVFAEMLLALGGEEDVFLGITSSGNSLNIVNAFMAAKAKGIRSVLLTGCGGGKCAELCDVAIRVPAEETYAIQEYHLPIYHALCAMVEARFFSPKNQERSAAL